MSHEVKLEIKALKSAIAQASAHHAAAKKELERLQNAKKQLLVLDQEYDQFQATVEKYKAAISDDHFKGSIRKEYDTFIENMMAELNTVKNGFQKNMGLLDLQIAAKEMETFNILSGISSTKQAVANLIKSLD